MFSSVGNSSSILQDTKTRLALNFFLYFLYSFIYLKPGILISVEVPLKHLAFYIILFLWRRKTNCALIPACMSPRLLYLFCSEELPCIKMRFVKKRIGYINSECIKELELIDTFAKRTARLDTTHYKIMLIIFTHFSRLCLYKYYIISNFEYNLKCAVFRNSLHH